MLQNQLSDIEKSSMAHLHRIKKNNKLAYVYFYTVVFYVVKRGIF